MDGRMAPQTELGDMINHIAKNIAPLTERESVKSSAASSFTALERPC